MKYYLRKYKLNESVGDEVTKQIFQHLKYKPTMMAGLSFGAFDSIRKAYPGFNSPKNGDDVSARLNFKIPERFNGLLEAGRNPTEDLMKAAICDYVKCDYNFRIAYAKPINKLGMIYTWKNGEKTVDLLIYEKEYNFSIGYIQNIIYFINDFLDIVAKCGGKDGLFKVIENNYKEALKQSKKRYYCPII